MGFYSNFKNVGVSVLGADRRNCPVCGGKNGDCVGTTRYNGGVNIIPKKMDDLRATFIVPKRIYEDTEVNGKKVRRLLYGVGAKITPEEAQRLGLMPKPPL